MHADVTPDTMKYYVGATLDKAVKLLLEQIKLDIASRALRETREVR